jgi:hypothetical protein
MQTYYLRCIAPDWPTMIALGVALGALADTEGTITATGGGVWDVIGPVHKPTGEQDADGQPIMAALTDDDGREYLHANLTTPIDLRQRAEQIAADRPEVAEAMADLGRFFLLDAQGNARAPAQPHRVLFTVPGG